MELEWTNIHNVSDDVIRNFDSGNDKFNDFLYNTAKSWNDTGESITYVFVDKNEKEENIISRILGFAAINSAGLLFQNTTDEYECLSCAEIRLFAIDKRLRKHHDQSIFWSDIIFKVLLQNLYQMSTSVIGFKAIFLNSNHDGYQLYTNNGFEPIDKYLTPRSDPKIDIGDCIPLLLTITSDTIYNIFSK